MDLGEIDGRLFVEHRRHRLRRARRLAVHATGDAGAASLGYARHHGRALLTSYVPRTIAITTAASSATRRARARDDRQLRAVRQQRADRARRARSTTGCWIWWWSRSDRGSRRVCGCRGCSTARSSACRGCTIRRIREATIEAEQPMTFHVDGEPVQGGTRCACASIRARCGSRCAESGSDRSTRSILTISRARQPRLRRTASARVLRRAAPARAGLLRVLIDVDDADRAACRRGRARSWRCSRRGGRGSCRPRR